MTTVGIAALAGSAGALLGLGATIATLGWQGILAAALFAVLGFMAGVWIALRIIRGRAAGRAA